MQEGKAGDAVKKRHDRGACLKVLLVHPPGLQGSAGHVKHFGRLTLGHPLGGERTIACQPLGAFEALPALGTIFIVTLLVLDYCSHSYLHLFKPRSWEKCLAQDGEVVLLLQSCTMSRHGLSRDRHLDQVADAMIEAEVA
jgi:hypothetical protein